MARLFKIAKVIVAKTILLLLGSVLIVPVFLFAYKFAFAEFIAFDSPALDVKGVFMLSSELCKYKRYQILKQLFFAIFVACFAAACFCAAMLIARAFLNFPKYYFAVFGCGFGAMLLLFVFLCLAQQTYQSAKQDIFLHKKCQN